MPWQMRITLDTIGVVSLKLSAPLVRPPNCTQLYTPRDMGERSAAGLHRGVRS